jgi:hypothetical protein
MTEDQLTKRFIKLAHDRGWVVAHFHRSPTQKGSWSTPVAADGKGFLDLVCVRERVVFIELKSDKRYPTREQRQWIERLEGAGAEVHVLRPRDLESGLVDEILGERLAA